MTYSINFFIVFLRVHLCMLQVYFMLEVGMYVFLRHLLPGSDVVLTKLAGIVYAWNRIICKLLN